MHFPRNDRVYAPGTILLWTERKNRHFGLVRDGSTKERERRYSSRICRQRDCISAAVGNLGRTSTGELVISSRVTANKFCVSKRPSNGGIVWISKTFITVTESNEVSLKGITVGRSSSRLSSDLMPDKYVRWEGYARVAFLSHALEISLSFAFTHPPVRQYYGVLYCGRLSLLISVNSMGVKRPLLNILV